MAPSPKFIIGYDDNGRCPDDLSARLLLRSIGCEQLCESMVAQGVNHYAAS
jgi:hypothetical protein